MIPCGVKACAESAKFSAAIKLWAVGCDKSTAHATLALSICVCDEHHSSIAPVRDFLPMKSRRLIERNFLDNGRRPPDFNSAEWEFSALQ